MAGLELKFLGGLEIIRDGKCLTLPPSKKTRALIPYLALNDRAFRREQLCELLWEIPDDPRGSLRWSLSKLRKLVDESERRRIIADRTSVSLDCSDLDIDVNSLMDFVKDIDTADVGQLESAVSQYDGNFLEGLELSDFQVFHAWTISQRESVLKAQTVIMKKLVEKLQHVPVSAIPHARKLVNATPYDESNRAILVQMLVSCGNLEEAEQQYQLGMRLLKEARREPTGLLFNAWREPPRQTQTEQVTADPLANTIPPLQPQPDLIGRITEQKQLLNIFHQVSDESRAAALMIQGAPGIGKSRLLEAAIENTNIENTNIENTNGEEALVLMGAAFESEAIRPFAVWMDALNNSKFNNDIFNSSEMENRDRLFDRLSNLVREQTEIQPVMLIFDDLHWCDDSSAAALHYVIRMNRDRRLFCILSGRADELRDNRGIQKTLRGLRHEGLLQYMKLDQLSDTNIKKLIELQSPEADSNTLYEHCAGNPLLAIELTRAVTSGNAVYSLRELVNERLAGLPLDAIELLRWSAIIPSRIDITMLSKLTDTDSFRVGDMLELAENLSILRINERGHHFTHDLIAQSIYGEISPTRLQVMHRSVAELLEKNTTDPDLASDLSHHASLSGDAALAARAAVSAGRLCLRFFANEDAVVQAQRGLQWAEKLSPAAGVQVIIELNDIMLTAAPVADWDSAANKYVALAEQALDHGAFAHARLGYHMASYVRWMHGQWAGALEQTLQAERVTRGGTEEEHIIGMAETAKCLAMIEQDLSQADAMLMEAQSLANRSRISHHVIPAALGMLRYHENMLDEAEDLFREARTLCKSAGNRLDEFQTLEYMAMIAIERQQFESAHEYCRSLVALGEKLREGSEAPFARAMDGLCRYALEDKTENLEISLEELRIADAKHRLAYILTRSAFLDIDRGRDNEAVSKANEALGYASLLERDTEVALANLALTVSYHNTGDQLKSLDHQRAVRQSLDKPIAVWASNRANSELELIAHD